MYVTEAVWDNEIEAVWESETEAMWDRGMEALWDNETTCFPSSQFPRKKCEATKNNQNQHEMESKSCTVSNFFLDT